MLASDQNQHSDHGHDDGLVHAHDWARLSPRAARPQLPVIIRAADEAYDDGLVHGHSWARTGN